MLVEVPLNLEPRSLPEEVEALLKEADQRISEFVQARLDQPIPAFVPCDFVLVYGGLREVVERCLAPGDLFCEWGSGYGVATCLAKMLEMEAVGIEIEGDLVRESEQLAEDFDLPVQFVQGSFLPPGTESLADACGETAWLRVDGSDAYEELELDPDDFSLIFAYPWPGEQHVLFRLFDKVASIGALLLTYHGLDGLRLQRKIRR